MAKFKLYLLNQTSLIESSSLSAMRVPISEFQISSSQYEDNLEQYWSLAEDEENTTQERMQNRQTATLLHNPYFCYTFDEKFQLHQNTQRTLTFSMARDIIREDRLEKNPFINYLYIGAQLLLEDKYDNHHLMTVSKISYEFHKLNTIFKYECQDSFNYQLARQNTGYEIINNIEDIDFIGAKSLDWWVRCKIQPECNISYDYIQLNQTRPGIKTIAYSADQYPDFHKTISFSASGTASSVLIALGEQYSLQLHVYERFCPSTNSNQGTIDKYYWFEPMKTLRPSGLKYSPDFNLQSFGLEHLGTSLSSVLNVQSNTVGEDLITIIPTIPAFFRTWFETEEWANSQFASGLFSSACQETIVNWTLEETNIEENQIGDSKVFKDDNNFVYLPISNNIQWDKKYDQIKFFTNGGLHSFIHISGFNAEGNSMTSVSYSSKYQPWTFGTCAINDGGSIVFTSLNTPEECIDKNIWIRLELPSNIEKTITVIGTLYLSQYREPTAEELEFASIADQIPWLENRLIDFTYFYEHSIITLKQYRDLMNIFENDLRKANAKLLLYSQLYYQSIQTKTKIISNLSAQLDMVGATFHADLVKPFQIDGRIQETTEFNLALSDLFSNKETSIELIDYYTTLADYVNKYITAEQAFLKNIYLFRKYFYESCGLGSLHHYTWVMNEETDSDEYKYSFVNKIDEYTKLNSTNYQKNIFIQTKINGINKYTPFDKNNVVTDYNNSKYYYLNPQKADGYKPINDNNKSQYGAWSKEATYYELQWEVSKEGSKKHDNFNLICNLLKNEDDSYAHEKIITDDKGKKFKLETLQKKDSGEITKIRISCYQHCLHTTETEDQSVYLDSTLSSIDLSQHRVFIKTNFAEMRQNYFYQTLVENNTILHNNRFIHRRLNDFDSLLQPANEWSPNFTSLNIDRNILTFLPNAKNWDSSRIDSDEELDIIYSESFPMTSWYYQETLADKSVKYHNVPFVNVENCITFMRRISVSAKARSNWLLWGGIGFGALGAVAGPVIGTAIGVGLVHGICSLVWTYGDYGFGNDGWTYQDIYGNDLNEHFQNYYTGTEIVYTSSEENYWNAVGDVKNPNTSSLTWSPTVAAGLLFTYLSYTNYLSYIKNNKKDDYYYYRTSYWRILTPDDTISKTDSIGIISLKNTNWIGNIQVCSETLKKTTDESKTYNRIDSIVYYPLENNIVYVSGSDFDWTNKNTDVATLQSLGWTVKEDSYYWLQKKYNEGSDYAIILKKENFKYQDFSEQTFSYDSISQIASAQYYDNITMQPVNLLQLCTDITKGFYITGLEDSDYSPLTDISDEWVDWDKDTQEAAIENFEIYEQIDSQWVRRYTKNQLIARQDTYVRTDNTYEYNSFAPVTTVNTQCYRYKKDSSDSSNWVFDQLLKCQIVYSKDDDSEDNSWKLKINENEIVSLNASEYLEDLSSYTNAEYWYKYRHHESVICREKAMLIETNLTEYWTNAYYASKNCKYFLPEFWQPTVDQTKNYYSVNILSPHCDQDEEEYTFKSIDLSTVYVPIVSKINKQHKFQFKHISQINDDQTVSTEQQYSLPLNEHVSLFDIAGSNTTIRNIMGYLNILPEAENWVGINVKNDYVMYEYIEGGSLWTEELQKLSKNALHYPDQFGGWYDMMIRVLMSCNYTNYSPILYKQAQEEHNQIWARLYAQYPHLLLEQSYSNENATTSEELLRMAQYAFRDYTQVESNYNITVIDPWTLKGYKGQELHIGDGIEVEATELYDDHDSDIYRSLIQYLYITDISYDLRKDDNIQLTVNSIKYQDKVIGQLIKLIR